MNTEFFTSIEYLKDELAGTENVCFLLYAMIKMLKPYNVLEMGVGYTTPFILQAIRENSKEYETMSHNIQQGCYNGRERNSNFLYYQTVPVYTYTGVDDMSHESASNAIEYIKRQSDISTVLHLDNYNTLPENKKYDFIWIDCGNFDDYVNILNNFTDIFEDNSYILIHNTAHTPLHALSNTLEIVEPNKDNQNSVSILRYRKKKETI
jgi:predicted O-methyltransferase YrrM